MGWLDADRIFYILLSCVLRVLQTMGRKLQADEMVSFIPRVRVRRGGVCG